MSHRSLSASSSTSLASADFRPAFPTDFFKYEGDYNYDSVQYNAWLENLELEDPAPRHQFNYVDPSIYEVIWIQVSRSCYIGGASGFGQINFEAVRNYGKDLIYLISFFLKIANVAKLKNGLIGDVRLVFEDLPGEDCDVEADIVNFVGYRFRLSQRRDVPGVQSFWSIAKEIMDENTLRINRDLAPPMLRYLEDMAAETRRIAEEIQKMRQAAVDETSEDEDYDEDEEEEEEEEEEPDADADAEEPGADGDAEMEPADEDENDNPGPRRKKSKKRKAKKQKTRYNLKRKFILKPLIPLPIPNPLAYHHILEREWHTLCDKIVILNSVNKNDYDPLVLSETHPNTQYNPTVVFDSFNSMAAVASFKPRTARECCSFDQYHLYRDGVSHTAGNAECLTFPFHGRFAYLVEIDTFTPQNWKSIYFPSVKKRISGTTSSEKRIYLGLADNTVLRDSPWIYPGSAGIDNMDRVLLPTSLAITKRRCNPEQTQYKYEEEVNVRPDKTNPYSIESLRENHKARLTHAQNQAYAAPLNEEEEISPELPIYLETDPEPTKRQKKFFFLRRKAQIASLREFEANLFHEHSNMPPAVRACFKFIHGWLRSHPNLCYPHSHKNVNLSPIGDFLAAFTSSLETIFGVNTIHRDVICFLFGSWHAFLQTPFHLNVLIAGPPTSNKSQRFKLLMMFLLVETYKQWTYSTPKAKTGTGDEQMDPSADKKYQCLTEIYEDVPPSAIGVTGNGKSSGTASSDTESIIKSILTTGTMSFSCVVSDENGKRTNVMKTIDVRSIMLMATNETARAIPAAINSRCNFIVDSIRERLDNNDLIGVMNLILDANGEKIKSETIEYMHLFQARLCLQCQLIYAGILEEVSLVASDTILTNVMNISDEFLLSKHKAKDSRNFDRCGKMMVPIIALVDSQLQSFDSAESILKDYPFDITHMVYLERHHRSTQEHAVIASGMLSHQVEDPVVANTCIALRNFITSETKRKKIQAKPLHRQNGQFNEDVLLYKALTLKANKATTILSPEFHLVMAQMATIANQIEPEEMKRNEHLLNDIANRQQTIEAALLNASSYESLQCSMDGQDDLFKNKSSSTPDELIHILAQRLLPTMKPRPALTDLIEALHILTNQQIPVIAKNKERISVCALSLTTKEIKMPEQTFQHLSEGRLYAALKRVLNHQYAQPANYVFGVCHINAPYVFQIIEVEENGGNDPFHLILQNPLYRDPDVADQSLGIVSSATGGGGRVNCFSTKKFITLSKTRDLDTYATEFLNNKIGISYTEANILPPFNSMTKRIQYSRAIRLEQYEEHPEMQHPRPYPNNIPLYRRMNQIASPEGRNQLRQQYQNQRPHIEEKYEMGGDKPEEAEAEAAYTTDQALDDMKLAIVNTGIRVRAHANEQIEFLFTAEEYLSYQSLLPEEQEIALHRKKQEHNLLSEYQREAKLHEQSERKIKQIYEQAISFQTMFPLDPLRTQTHARVEIAERCILQYNYYKDFFDKIKNYKWLLCEDRKDDIIQQQQQQPRQEEEKDDDDMMGEEEISQEELDLIEIMNSRYQSI